MNVYTHIYCYILNDIKRHYRLYTVYHSAQHTRRIPCVGTFHLQVEGLRQDVVFHVLAWGMTSMSGFSREWGWRSWEIAFSLIVAYQVQTSRIQAKPMFTFCFTFLYTVWHGFAICHGIQECASLCKSQERQRDLAELMDIAKQRDAGDKGSFCKFWASLMMPCSDSITCKASVPRFSPAFAFCLCNSRSCGHITMLEHAWIVLMWFMHQLINFVCVCWLEDLCMQSCQGEWNIFKAPDAPKSSCNSSSAFGASYSFD